MFDPWFKKPAHPLSPPLYRCSCARLLRCAASRCWCEYKAFLKQTEFFSVAYDSWDLDNRLLWKNFKKECELCQKRPPFSGVQISLCPSVTFPLLVSHHPNNWSKKWPTQMCRHVQTDLTLTWENKNMWSSGSLWRWREEKESRLCFKRVTVPIIFKKSVLLTGNMDHWGISRTDWQRTSTVSAGRGEIMKGRWSVCVCVSQGFCFIASGEINSSLCWSKWGTSHHSLSHQTG